MRITADHAFHIGTRHLRGGTPCQDYALSDTLDSGAAYACVSDGCSGGKDPDTGAPIGGKTDVGARIILHTAAAALAGGIDPSRPGFAEACFERDIVSQQALGLQFEDMAATRLVVNARKGDDKIVIRIDGDGVFAVVSRDGGIRLWRIDWKNNMPAYPVYGFDGFKTFAAAHGGDFDSEALSIDVYELHANGYVVDCSINQPLGSGIYNLWNRLPIYDVAFAAVFSDGVTQVGTMDWRDVVKELLAFKSLEGDFVKRRMTAFLRDAAKKGHHPADDIAMACLRICHEVA